MIDSILPLLIVFITLSVIISLFEYWIDSIDKNKS